jgi:hypothetical protein
MPTFRRLFAATWSMALLLGLSGRADETIALFNGKDLEGWVAEGVKESSKDGETRPVWTVKDGMILCNGWGFGFLRYDRREFRDFVLYAEFRMAPKCNSGLGVRTRAFVPAQSKATRPSYYSYEIQLTDDAGKPTTKTSSGSLYRYVAPKENAVKAALEWNRIAIECVGPRIKVTLNDREIIDVDQGTIPELKDKPLRGYVCLQNHGGTIEFRDIRVREIKPASDGASGNGPG